MTRIDTVTKTTASRWSGRQRITRTAQPRPRSARGVAPSGEVEDQLRVRGLVLRLGKVLCVEFIDDFIEDAQQFLAVGGFVRLADRVSAAALGSEVWSVETHPPCRAAAGG